MEQTFKKPNPRVKCRQIESTVYYVDISFNNCIDTIRLFGAAPLTRVIQKISSVCEYCLCSAAVTIVRMGAEFVVSVARHGQNLQTFGVFTHSAVFL